MNLNLTVLIRLTMLNFVQRYKRVHDKKKDLLYSEASPFFYCFLF